MTANRTNSFWMNDYSSAAPADTCAADTTTTAAERMPEDMKAKTTSTRVTVPISIYGELDHYLIDTDDFDEMPTEPFIRKSQDDKRSSSDGTIGIAALVDLIDRSAE